MCEIIEELVKEGEERGEARGVEKEKETRVARAISLKKLSLPEIAEMFEIPLAKVSEIGKLHNLLQKVVRMIVFLKEKRIKRFVNREAHDGQMSWAFLFHLREIKNVGKNAAGKF